MEKLSIVDVQEKLKDLKSPEEVGAFFSEVFGPSFDSFIEQKVAERAQPSKGDIQSRILSLKTTGLPNTSIQSYLKEAHGVDVSRDEIATAMESVLPHVEEWQNRPLSRVYPVVVLDGIRFKAKDGNKIINKCSYSVLGINEDGMKEILGIWIGDNESSKFWMQILNDMKGRGVEDVLIACIDGLTGFPEAIRSVFPNATIQQCVFHLIKNSSKHVKHKDQDQWYDDLKMVYTAPTEDIGFAALEAMEPKWPAYNLYLKCWKDKWAELSHFYAYSEPVRRLIYTTNHVESFHSQLRRITDGTTVFPSTNTLLALIWLGQRKISKSWSVPLKDWGEIISQLSIMFPGRISLY